MTLIALMETNSQQATVAVTASRHTPQYGAAKVVGALISFVGWIILVFSNSGMSLKRSKFSLHRQTG